MTRAFVMAAALACAAAPAVAARMTLGGVEIPGRGFFSLEPVDLTETFDLADGSCGVSQPAAFLFEGASAAPGAVAAFLDPATPRSYNGAILRGSTLNRHRTPKGDTSCYLAAKITSLETPGDIEYLGFHWSSIDEYNFVQLMEWFWDPIPIDGFGGNWIHGDQLADRFGVGLYGDQYVNFHFEPWEAFGLTLWLESVDNWAFEIDNISIRYRGSAGIAPAAALSARATPGVGDVRDVPAPGALALFGLGLAGLVAGRARRGPAAQG